MKRLGMLCLGVLILFPCLGQAQQQEGSFDDWRVMTMQEKTGKVCYVTSVPSKQEGNFTKRDQPYAMVTAWGKGATEVSVASGYPYKVEKAIELVIDDTAKYQLFSNKKIAKIAWASNASEHQKIIDGMIKGTQMTVHGTSQRGTTSKDGYSLKGFAKAYKAMKDLCSTAAVTPPKAPPTTSSSTTQKLSQEAVPKSSQKAVPKSSQKTSPKP
jgi:hypothetical protein